MKISTKGRYGLRVMMELAGHFGEGPLLVDSIAQSQGISGKYIHVLVCGLKTAGLIRAVRGPSGGYALTREPSRITALEIVTALEGPLAPVECVNRASVCTRAATCATRDLWCEIATAVNDILGRLTLEQLVANQQAKQQQPVSTAVFESLAP